MTNTDNIKQPNTTAIVKDCIINQEKRQSLLDDIIIPNNQQKYKGRCKNSALCNKRYRL